MPDHDALRRLAASQAGLATRAQLAALGVDRWAIAHRIETERWQRISPTVIATMTGDLAPDQRLWAGVLHAGAGAIVAGVHAAELAGLRNWHRDEITVLSAARIRPPTSLPGYRFIRTRRDLDALRSRDRNPPACRLEPAVLLFASEQLSSRTRSGVLAAAIQQRLTTSELLLDWLDCLLPLPRSAHLRAVLVEISGGADSTAELDVARMCRLHRLATPTRQTRRRDSSGRLRYTDCEWRLPDGRFLVLEVDGAFHMEIEHWEDDIARQRGLTNSSVVVVRCTARELRDEPEAVARDLIRLGVPRL